MPSIVSPGLDQRLPETKRFSETYQDSEMFLLSGKGQLQDGSPSKAVSNFPEEFNKLPRQYSYQNALSLPKLNRSPLSKPLSSMVPKIDTKSALPGEQCQITTSQRKVELKPDISRIPEVFLEQSSSLLHRSQLPRRATVGIPPKKPGLGTDRMLAQVNILDKVLRRSDMTNLRTSTMDGRSPRVNCLPVKNTSSYPRYYGIMPMLATISQQMESEDANLVSPIKSTGGNFYGHMQTQGSGRRLWMSSRMMAKSQRSLAPELSRASKKVEIQEPIKEPSQAERERQLSMASRQSEQSSESDERQSIQFNMPKVALMKPTAHLPRRWSNFYPAGTHSNPFLNLQKESPKPNQNYHSPNLMFKSQKIPSDLLILQSVAPYEPKSAMIMKTSTTKERIIDHPPASPTGTWNKRNDRSNHFQSIAPINHRKAEQVGLPLFSKFELNDQDSIQEEKSEHYSGPGSMGLESLNQSKGQLVHMEQSLGSSVAEAPQTQSSISLLGDLPVVK